MGIGQWLNAPPAVFGSPMVGVYVPLFKSETGINIDYSQIKPACLDIACETEKKINKRDIGVLGTIGEEMNHRATSRQARLFDIIDGATIFRTSARVVGINWDFLYLNSIAYAPADIRVKAEAAYFAYNVCQVDAGFSAVTAGGFVDCSISEDPLGYLPDYFWPYIISIAASLAMAVVTMFIFLMLLRSLPFIGIGISGETLSIPRLGVGRLAMPGANSFERFQNRIFNSVTGRNTP
jgi:hypothetical protein